MARKKNPYVTHPKTGLRVHVPGSKVKRLPAGKPEQGALAEHMQVLAFDRRGRGRAQAKRPSQAIGKAGKFSGEAPMVMSTEGPGTPWKKPRAGMMDFNEKMTDKQFHAAMIESVERMMILRGKSLKEAVKMAKTKAIKQAPKKFKSMGSTLARKKNPGPTMVTKMKIFRAKLKSKGKGLTASDLSSLEAMKSDLEVSYELADLYTGARSKTEKASIRTSLRDISDIRRESAKRKPNPMGSAISRTPSGGKRLSLRFTPNKQELRLLRMYNMLDEIEGKGPKEIAKTISDLRKREAKELKELHAKARIVAPESMDIINVIKGFKPVAYVWDPSDKQKVEGGFTAQEYYYNSSKGAREMEKALRSIKSSGGGYFDVHKGERSRRFESRRQRESRPLILNALYVYGPGYKRHAERLNHIQKLQEARKMPKGKGWGIPRDNDSHKIDFIAHQILGWQFYPKLSEVEKKQVLKQVRAWGFADVARDLNGSLPYEVQKPNAKSRERSNWHRAMQNPEDNPGGVPYAKIQKELKTRGFSHVRTRGSHEIFESPTGRHVSVPRRARGKMMAPRYMKQIRAASAPVGNPKGSRVSPAAIRAALKKTGQSPQALAQAKMQQQLWSRWRKKESMNIHDYILEEIRDGWVVDDVTRGTIILKKRIGGKDFEIGIGHSLLTDPDTGDTLHKVQFAAFKNGKLIGELKGSDKLTEEASPEDQYRYALSSIKWAQRHIDPAGYERELKARRARSQKRARARGPEAKGTGKDVAAFIRRGLRSGPSEEVERFVKGEQKDIFADMRKYAQSEVYDNPKGGGFTAAQKKKLRLGWGKVQPGFMISETVLSKPVRAMAIYRKGKKWGSSVVDGKGKPIKLIETFKHSSAFAAAKSAEDIVLCKPKKKAKKKVAKKNPKSKVRTKMQATAARAQQAQAQMRARARTGATQAQSSTGWGGLPLYPMHYKDVGDGWILDTIRPDPFSMPPDGVWLNKGDLTLEIYFKPAAPRRGPGASYELYKSRNLIDTVSFRYRDERHVFDEIEKAIKWAGEHGKRKARIVKHEVGVKPASGKGKDEGGKAVASFIRRGLKGGPRAETEEFIRRGMKGDQKDIFGSMRKHAQSEVYDNPKGKPGGKKVRVTEAMRQEIYRRAFALFKKWNGRSYSDMIRDGDMAMANMGNKNFAHAGLEIANQYGLSHNQRYHVLEGFSAHVLVMQDRVLGKNDYILKWNSRTRRYDSCDAKTGKPRGRFDKACIEGGATSTLSMRMRKPNPSRKKVAKKKASKKKIARKKTPPYQLLINRCQKLWTSYCDRPSKKRLEALYMHLDKMKASTSKKVATERSRCLRAANAEAKKLKYKRK